MYKQSEATIGYIGAVQLGLPLWLVDAIATPSEYIFAKREMWMWRGAWQLTECVQDRRRGTKGC